jgi:hypothetical protein
MIEVSRKLASVCLLGALTLFPLLPVSLEAQMGALPGHTIAGKVQSVGVAARVVDKIDEKRMMPLTGHVRPFLNKTVDHGQVDGSQQLGAIMLMLSRTAQQQADLDSYVDQLHNRRSANFHKWLTPAEFGARFQPADADVLAVRTWLESKGLTVLDVMPSKTYISFTGTVGQLRSVFKADIHHVSINGEEHMATVNEPQIPLALAPVVGGLHKLDDFSPKPLIKKFGSFVTDKRTGKTTQVAGTSTGPTANFTFTDAGSNTYEMGPQDFYTIYNESPLLSAGITGAGQTIAVIEEVQVATADVTTFRSVFGLPTYPTTPNATGGGVNYLIGNSTSGLGGYASCFAPVTQARGKTSEEESEADLDLQWAGAVAPNAIVDFVACGGTKTSGDGNTLGSLGIDHSAQYVANFLSSTVVAASMSYGECEADMSGSATTGVGYYNNQWQQFAAEGITPIISSGDGGAEQCYQNDANATTLPPSVNGFGSSAYNVSAGGTDFGDLYESNNYATTPVGTWWNPTNGAGQSSAVTYVPETTWAGYCSNQLFASYLQNSGSTTYGTTYTPSAICSSAGASSNGLLAVVGGAGGISTFNPIPTWQSVYGVGANSVSSTARNLPDVSLFASNGFWGHYMPYCESDVDPCTVTEYETGVNGAGGTSFVAPQLAGLMALISQKTNQRQGQANYTFYNLAAQEYGLAGTAGSTLKACSGSAVVPGQRPPDSCYFYDVSNDMPSLQGGTITPGIYQPCLAADIDCYKGAGTTYGVNTVPGTTATAGILGYTASPGFDDATGLGSLNINGVVQGWNNTTPSFASTSVLTTSASTILATSSVILTATVTATGRGGAVAPAGTVEFFIGTTGGTLLGSAPIAAVCTGTGAATSCNGSAALTVAGSALPPGSDSIIAYFEGDGANDAPSTSTPQTVKVYSAPFGNLEQAVDATTSSTTVSTLDKLYISGWVADAVDGAPLSNVTVLIDGSSVGTPTLGIARPDVATSYGKPAYTNSGYNLTYPAGSLAVGNHAVTVTAVNGDGQSTTFGPLNVTVTVTYPSPVGNLEVAADAVTGASTVSQADALFVGGWAADPTDGTPLQTLQVFVDGTFSGNATQGIARPDVVTATGNPAYANSGFSFTTSAATLAVGPHTVTVRGTNKHGVVTTYGPRTITVTASMRPPVGHLDLAVNSANGSSSVPTSGSLFVGGWAADYQDNGPAKVVQIAIDGTVVGTATLGGSRPDVASAYSNPAWANTGWSFAYGVGSLSVGGHTVTATAQDSLGLKTSFGPISFTVTP